MKSRYQRSTSAGLLQRPEHRPGIDRVDGWSWNRNEVTTPKLPPPPRIAQKRSVFSLSLAVTKRAVGQDDIGFQQVVDRQTELAGEVADAAAEGHSANTRGGDDAAGSRQAEGVRWRDRTLAEQRPTFDPRRARCRIDAHPIHRRQIEDQSVVDSAQPGAVVPAATDRQQQTLFAGEVDSPAMTSATSCSAR